MGPEPVFFIRSIFFILVNYCISDSDFHKKFHKKNGVYKKNGLGIHFFYDFSRISWALIDNYQISKKL